MTGLTRQYGDFVAQLGAGQIAVPEHCAALVRTGLADAVGVMFAGSREPLVGKLAEALPRGTSESSLPMGQRSARSLYVALRALDRAGDGMTSLLRATLPLARTA